MSVVYKNSMFTEAQHVHSFLSDIAVTLVEKNQKKAKVNMDHFLPVHKCQRNWKTEPQRR